jgi:hypothetical protein
MLIKIKIKFNPIKKAIERVGEEKMCKLSKLVTFLDVRSRILD